MHPFTSAEAANPEFSYLIRKSGNAYTFAADGYDPYFSANINITKEIGDYVSLSLNAINFTNSRPYVKSHATGVSALFTPDFYYGLTCRIKFELYETIHLHIITNSDWHLCGMHRYR